MKNISIRGTNSTGDNVDVPAKEVKSVVAVHADQSVVNGDVTVGIGAAEVCALVAMASSKTKGQ